MPLIQGSNTPSAKVVATTASTQSPPAASTSAPTSAALRDCAATIPPFEMTAGLRICWALLKRSGAVRLVLSGKQLPPKDKQNACAAALASHKRTRKQRW